MTMCGLRGGVASLSGFPATLSAPTSLLQEVRGGEAMVGEWRYHCRWLRVTRGLRQGCPASGTVWALLYDPIVGGMWLFLPRDGLWTTVFADDIALAVRNLFRDLKVLRRYMDVVKVGTGLAPNADKSAVLNFTRH